MDQRFQMLASVMIRPAPKVANAVNAFRDLFLNSNTTPYVVGLHIRTPMYDFENDMVPRVCTESFFARADSLLEGKPAGSKVFLATPSMRVKALALAYFGPERLVTRSGIVIDRLLDSGQGEFDAAIDMWLLALCNDMVTSHMSTFGYVAHGIAGLSPHVVMPRDTEEEEFSDELCASTPPELLGRDVHHMPMSSPCFHKWQDVFSEILDCIDLDTLPHDILPRQSCGADRIEARRRFY